MEKHRLLVLGGTTEARELAAKLAGDRRFDTTLSLAGRTLDPRPQPVPVRTGGFGGAEGLAAYLKEERIACLIDATHLFAARISHNAVEAVRKTGIAALVLSRPAWTAQPGDEWTRVGSIAAAVEALGSVPRRVFLAIGRQEAYQFSARPEHAYVVRSVDPVTPPMAVPDATYILDCGPFAPERELALLRDQRIDVVVAKNSGGSATYGKIEAARALRVPVIMVERAIPPGLPVTGGVDEALTFLDHAFSPAMKRGV